MIDCQILYTPPVIAILRLALSRTKKIRQQRLSTDLISFWPWQLPCELFHCTTREQKTPPQVPSFFGENYTREALNTEKKKKKKKRERIYEGETPNRGNQKLVCLQFSG